MNHFRDDIGKAKKIESAFVRDYGAFLTCRKPCRDHILAWRTGVLSDSVKSLPDAKKTAGLRMMSKQRPAEATRLRFGLP